jgi:hypothetical protein
VIGMTEEFSDWGSGIRGVSTHIDPKAALET